MQEANISFETWIILCKEHSIHVYEILRLQYGLARQSNKQPGTGTVNFDIVDEQKYLFFKLKYE